MISLYSDEKGFLSEAEVMRRAPSAFRKQPHEDCSDRYEFIDTQEVLGYLGGAGYRVSAAYGGKRGRSATHGAHTIRMRMPGIKPTRGDVFPEIVLTNSHDRTCRGKLNLGMYRLICSNGMVVSEGQGVSFSIPHIGDKHDIVVSAANRIMEQAPTLLEVVERWGERMMTAAEVGEFNRRALVLKPGIAAEDMVVTSCRRSEDSDASLWNVFNRAQENIIRGGIGYRNEKGRYRRTRQLTDVKKTLDINQKLWSLAEEFLPA